MDDKNRNTTESKDAFFELIPRSDVPTESKTNAAEPCKPRVKKEEKRNKKEKECCFSDVMTTSIPSAAFSSQSLRWEIQMLQTNSFHR